MPRQQRYELIKTLPGRVRLERRNGSKVIYAAAYLAGRNVVKSTGETSEREAEKKAVDWFLDQRDQIRRGVHKNQQTHTLEAVINAFIAHRKATKTNQGQLDNFTDKLTLLKNHKTLSHVLTVSVKDIDAAWLIWFRNERSKDVTNRGTPVSNSTLKKDMTFLHMVLTYAREFPKIITTVPQFPSFRAGFAIEREGAPEFSKSQYKKLLRTAWKRMKEPDLIPRGTGRARKNREELYVLILVMMGAALRVGEAYSLRWRDVRLDQIDADGFFRFWVTGKHGKGKPEPAYMRRREYLALVRLFKSRKAETTVDSKVFTENHREGFKDLLKECGLHVDKKTGKTRNLKSLRPSSITFRLQRKPTPDFHDVADWSRTSAPMIVAWYDRVNPDEGARRVVMGKS
jgi:integrase